MWIEWTTGEENGLRVWRSRPFSSVKVQITELKPPAKEKHRFTVQSEVFKKECLWMGYGEDLAQVMEDSVAIARREITLKLKEHREDLERQLNQVTVLEEELKHAD